MTETLEGTLNVRRVFKPRRATLDGLLADYIQPRYYKQPSAYITWGPTDERGNHEFVYGLRGKVLDSLTVEDNGRQVRVTGDVTRNPTTDRIGSVKRVRLEFLSDG